MISELKKAIEKAERLSEKDQQMVAKIILDEISWGEKFADSQSKLSFLAQEALDEYKKGDTKPLDL
ncbi:MAG TPA: hypothetical protein VK517_18415 [Cyclobacteriaceae bacterium]|nr:hypothetical protein [Cyclobacteriaceae bacterium]